MMNLLFQKHIFYRSQLILNKFHHTFGPQMYPIELFHKLKGSRHESVRHELCSTSTALVDVVSTCISMDSVYS